MRSYAIVTGDFVQTGGMDRANVGLAEYLARRGGPVHLVAHRASDDLLARSNVTFHRVPKPFGRYALGAPLLASAGIAQAVAAAMRRGIVVVNGGNCVVPAVNWVHYVHAAEEAQMQRAGRPSAAAQHRISTLTERLALRAARIVVANSDRTRRDVVDRVGVPDERVRTVYLGIDPARFGLVGPDERVEARRALQWSGANPRVAFVGAMGDRRKGFDVLYDAWRILCARTSWDADLVVIGAGRDLPTWRDRAARDGLSTRIAFLGFRRDLPTLLAACDAVVAPSRYEPYGLVVHEALCRGLPALVASAAGIAERYPPALRGLLLEDAESATGIARALERWRSRTPEVAAGVLAFSDVLRARSWDDMAREIVALSESTCE